MSKQRKELSFAKRLARTAAWTSFATVIGILALWVHIDQMDFSGWVPHHPPPPQAHSHRPRTVVHPPVSEVPPDLFRLEIQIEAKDVEVLRGYHWHGWQGRQQTRPQVLATVRENGVIYTNVALHLKGAAGSFRPFDDKPALTLNFNKHAKGQRFHGYSKISLNNSVQDPTFLCEALSRELFDAAGVPVPRADHATVILNGRDLGLYVMTEGYNKDFLRRYFKNVKGNLYDGGFCQEVHSNLSVNSGDNPDDRSDLQRLIAAVRESDPQRRWESLSQVLDMDRFITFLAMEILTCHWDGYGLNRNNYRLFHDLDSGRMIFMPHGMDQVFDWPPGRYPPEASLHPTMKGDIARAALATTEGWQKYWERVAFLQTNVFKEELLSSRINELSLRIRPTIAAYSPSLAQQHDARVASLNDRVVRRARFIAREVANPKEPARFDGGTALLSAWRPHVTTQSSALRFNQAEDDDTLLLQIAANQRGGTGSWRTSVWLESGRYRFEGLARAHGASDNISACLRISGARSSLRTIRREWTPLSCSFNLEGHMTEVVLVCEAQGAEGEVWFDAESLRLVRLESNLPQREAIP
jgi:spore coat protein H